MYRDPSSRQHIQQIQCLYQRVLPGNHRFVASPFRLLFFHQPVDGLGRFLGTADCNDLEFQRHSPAGKYFQQVQLLGGTPLADPIQYGFSV